MNTQKFIHLERITNLNKKIPNKTGKYVLYWVQASQRTIYNHALELAIIKANEQKLPLIAYFGITAKYPNANQRPYIFMLQGLQQLQKDLAKRKIQLIILQKSPDEGAILLGKDASTIIVDFGYLRIQREWRKNVADKVQCDVIQVESDVLVPVQAASDKEEFAARTIRNKITSKIDFFSTPVENIQLNNSSLDLKLEHKSFDISNIDQVIDILQLDKSVTPVKEFIGGEQEARKIFNHFLTSKMNSYALNRNDPSKDATSNLSPYLHFGMISPVFIHNETLRLCKSSESRASFLEEVIVRRELSMNFCFYNVDYDKYSCLPQWCRDTLAEHSGDKRPYLYSREQLENAQTHDEFWNSAQKEAIFKGKISGYMRMYWGKKVLEWSQTPQQAYETMIYLNDKYHLDGRDPNGYTGVAWCFGKHDRPWTRREIFGTIRYMNDKGLKKKFDANVYVSQSQRNYREWKKQYGEEEEQQEKQFLFMKKIKKQ